ncbi:MAG TPA: murein L,D-transpeptidase catalytic domain family protein [Vicinamibacterales bacterium]|nr:murein L,D-transpeptidase catalytic domain family protein [Vicinamibacterales bacterium]
MSPRNLLTTSVLLLTLATFSGREAVSAAGAPESAVALSTSAWMSAGIGALEPRIFEMALRAASCAVRSGAIADLSTLTVIDYSRPSTQKRLWVFDVNRRALLYEELVAHGSGSGDNLARAFSNQNNSHQSSLGLFRTDETYVGKNGYSLRLHGLDAGFNDHAYDRAIVMHGAPYVSDDIAKNKGRLGRSWGCPALREGIAREVIDTVKGTGLVFAYYPDPAWLAASKYLGDCGGEPHLAAGL